jgi:hypothetical protein
MAQWGSLSDMKSDMKQEENGLNPVHTNSTDDEHIQPPVSGESADPAQKMSTIKKFLSENQYFLVGVGITLAAILTIGGTILIQQKLRSSVKETEQRLAVANMQSDQSENDLDTANEATDEAVPTPDASTQPTAAPSPKASAQTKYTASPKPSPKPSPVPSPTPAATSLPASPVPSPFPSPTPRTPNPPQISVTYPTENQEITFTSPTQTFCVVDVPTGGDTTGTQRHYSSNGQGWTLYSSATLCYEPAEGSNTLQLQYKNSYGDEGSVITRHFTFHRTVACQDGDGGKIYTTKGTASNGSSVTCFKNDCATYCPTGTCTDFCVAQDASTASTSGPYVLEWFCYEGRITYELRLCTGSVGDTQACNDGACQ